MSKKKKIRYEEGSGNVFKDLGLDNAELLLATSAAKVALDKIETIPVSEFFPILTELVREYLIYSLKANRAKAEQG